MLRLLVLQPEIPIIVLKCNFVYVGQMDGRLLSALIGSIKWAKMAITAYISIVEYMASHMLFPTFGKT